MVTVGTCPLGPSPHPATRMPSGDQCRWSALWGAPSPVPKSMVGTPDTDPGKGRLGQAHAGILVPVLVHRQGSLVCPMGHSPVPSGVASFNIFPLSPTPFLPRPIFFVLPFPAWGPSTGILPCLRNSQAFRMRDGHSYIVPYLSLPLEREYGKCWVLGAEKGEEPSIGQGTR